MLEAVTLASGFGSVKCAFFSNWLEAVTTKGNKKIHQKNEKGVKAGAMVSSSAKSSKKQHRQDTAPLEDSRTSGTSSGTKLCMASSNILLHVHERRHSSHSSHEVSRRIHERWTNKSQTPVGRLTKRDFWQQIRVKKTGIVKPQPAKNFNWSNPLANSTSKGGNTPGRLGKKPTRRESKVLSGVFLRL